jgi:hypothetical protein
VLSLLAGCASPPSTEPLRAFAANVALPAPVAAAVVAGAMRQALPFADPRPQAAPIVGRSDGGALVVAYGRCRDGGWWPLGDQRLGLQLGAVDPAGVPTIDCTFAARENGPVPGGATIPLVSLSITATAAGSAVAGRLSPHQWQAVQQALQLAVRPEQAGAGLGEHNLQCLVVQQLCALAATTTDPDRARALRLRAASTGCAPADLQRRLGEAEGLAGDHAAAADRYWHAIAITDRPTQRAALVQQLAAQQAEADHPAYWRIEARQRLSADDLIGAARCLHLARRDRPDAVADYRLASLVHHRAGEPMAALASALLAREHAGNDGELVAFADRLWRDETQRLHGARRASDPIAGDWWSMALVSQPAAAAPLR